MVQTWILGRGALECQQTKFGRGQKYCPLIDTVLKLVVLLGEFVAFARTFGGIHVLLPFCSKIASYLIEFAKFRKNDLLYTRATLIGRDHCSMSPPSLYDPMTPVRCKSSFG